MGHERHRRPAAEPLGQPHRAARARKARRGLPPLRGRLGHLGADPRAGQRAGRGAAGARGQGRGPGGDHDDQPPRVPRDDVRRQRHRRDRRPGQLPARAGRDRLHPHRFRGVAAGRGGGHGRRGGERAGRVRARDRLLLDGSCRGRRPVLPGGNWSGGAARGRRARGQPSPDHVHLRHHRAPQGRCADPPEPHVPVAHAHPGLAAVQPNG